MSVGSTKPAGRHTRVVDGALHVWLVEDLWRASASLPVEHVDPASVIDLDRDGWFGAASVTPRRVLEHMSRILDADLDRPVILDADGTLLDGAHRACKALLLRERTIAVVRFTTTPTPSHVESIADPST